MKTNKLTQWVRAFGTTERNEQGQILTLTGHQINISDQHALASELSQSEERYCALLERFPQPVALQQEGRLVYLNPRLIELVGERVHVGAPVLSIFPVSDRIGAAQLLQGCTDANVQLLCADGATRSIDLSVTPLSDEPNSTAIVIFRDLTAQQKLQANLTRMDRLMNLGRIAAGVAHEINNPLTYILINLNLIKQGLSQEVLSDLHTLEQLDAAIEGSSRIKEIVQELKIFSRREENRLGPVSLKSTMRTALRMVDHRICLHATLIEDFPPGPCMVLASEGQLCQVFLNLLNNAWQALDTEKLNSNEIRLRIALDGLMYRIEIEDTGSGISDAVLDRLFEPFFTTKPPNEGTGLGLNICDHIVQFLGGTLAVDSEPGVGTCVRILLPVSEQTEKFGGLGTISEKPLDTNRSRVLIVDDERSLCLALQRYLSRDFEVEIATSGQEALDILQGDQEIHLVLCDLRMSPIGGRHIHSWIGANRPDLLERFLFITAGAANEADQSFLTNLTTPIVTKPFDLDQLRQLLLQMVADRSKPAPARSGRERRSASRFPVEGISGFLRIERELIGFQLVNCSMSGVRLRVLPDQLNRILAAVRARSQPIFELTVHHMERSEMAQLQARFVRVVEKKPDACFQLLHLSARNQGVYSRWMDAHESPRAGLRP